MKLVQWKRPSQQAARFGSFCFIFDNVEVSQRTMSDVMQKQVSIANLMSSGCALAWWPAGDSEMTQQAPQDRSAQPQLNRRPS
jgi:hypothetical protein